MEFFVLYDVNTAEEIARMSGQDGMARLQPLGESRGVVLIGQEDFADRTPLLDIDPVGICASLWEFTKIIRSQMLVRGALTQWGVVDSDAQSILNLQIKLMAAQFGSEPEYTITPKDNDPITLMRDDMIVLIQQAMAFLDGIHDHARNLRAALYSAPDTESLLKIDIFRGWPALNEGGTNG